MRKNPQEKIIKSIYQCKNFVECRNSVTKQGDICKSCKSRELEKKRKGTIVQPDLAQAMEFDMREKNIISPISTNKEENDELPPRQGSIDNKLKQLPILETDPEQLKRPTSDIILIRYSPTLPKRPFSIATDTPSTSTPITGSTEDIPDPALFPKLRTGPSLLSRSGAISQRGKDKTQEQVSKDDNVKLSEVASYTVQPATTQIQGEGIEAVLDFYDAETSEKVENEDENIRKRLTNSIYFGLEELEKLRNILPNLDDERLGTITEEIEQEANEEDELDSHQSIYLEPETVGEFKELYQQEASKPGFNSKKFFRNVKRGVDKVKQTGETVAQRLEKGKGTFDKGVQIANRAAGVVFNPTTANITKIVAGEVLKAMPGGIFLAGAVEGAANAAATINQKRQQARELKNLQSQELNIPETSSLENPLGSKTEEIGGKGIVESDTEEFMDAENEEEVESEQIDTKLDTLINNFNNLDTMVSDGFGVCDDNFQVMNNNFGVIDRKIEVIKKQEGERFNAISETLKTISSGVLDPRANFSVDENGDNSLPTPLTQPFDMKQTAYDIRDEVLNIKSEFSAFKTKLEQKQENKTNWIPIIFISAIVIITNLAMLGISKFFSAKKDDKEKEK